jgi:hypothetical protein
MAEENNREVQHRLYIPPVTRYSGPPLISITYVNFFCLYVLEGNHFPTDLLIEILIELCSVSIQIRVHQLVNKERCQLVDHPASYFGDPGFKSRPFTPLPQT